MVACTERPCSFARRMISMASSAVSSAVRPWFAMLLLATGLAQAPSAVASDEALAGVRDRIEQPEVLRGRFEQEKQLKGFRNPLRSAGTMLLVREKGIAWDTSEPFASSAVLTRLIRLQREQIAQLKAFYGVQEHCLETLLRADGLL